MHNIYLTLLNLSLNHQWCLDKFRHKDNKAGLKRIGGTWLWCRKLLVMLGFSRDAESCHSCECVPPSFFTAHPATSCVIYFKSVCLSLPPGANFGVWKRQQRAVTKMSISDELGMRTVRTSHLRMMPFMVKFWQTSRPWVHQAPVPHCETMELKKSLDALGPKNLHCEIRGCKTVDNFFCASKLPQFDFFWYQNQIMRSDICKVHLTFVLIPIPWS